MDFEEIREFQVSQQEIVAMTGAFLVPLNSFSESISTSEENEINLTDLRQMQLIVREFLLKASCIEQFCTKYHYRVYYDEIRRPSNRIAALLGNQTLSSKALEKSLLLAQLNLHIEGISEVMMAIAQIVTPSVDVNVKATNAFSAYCFISTVIDATKTELILVDPYIDQNIFYRYLYRLPKEIKIKIITDQDKLKGVRLSEFESIEDLFKSEYPNYVRELRVALHDRYLINEVSAFTLGGSIKDAAKKSDFSIVQLTDTKRIELYELYA